MKRFLLILQLTLLPALAHAQLPTRLVQASDITYLGSFRLPSAGTLNGTWAGDEMAINYGGSALTLLPDGTLLVGCHGQHDKAAVVSIPPIGGTAKVVRVCTSISGLGAIGDGAKTLGGGLAYNGRLILSAYVDYDATAGARASHTARGLDLSGSSPWVRIGALNPGFYGGYMSAVPQEWQAALGAPAVTGLCCVSIISRSSYGPALFGFDPDDVGVRSVSTIPYVYYSPAARALGGAQNGSNTGPGDDLYNWSTNIRGVAFVPGTASVLFIGRHGTGRHCYGTGAACGDPVDSGQGNHAYPYRHQIWAYSAHDFVAVKSGAKQPWEVQPYAIIPLPGMATNSAHMWGGAVYDPATRRLYVAPDFYESPRIYVYEIAAGAVAPPPPTPVDAVVSDWSAWGPMGEWSLCVAPGTQTRSEERTRTVVTPATNGGTTPALRETRVASRACTLPVTVSPEVRAVITAEIERVLATWPRPSDGATGPAGPRGADGDPGRDGTSVSIEQVRAIIDQMLATLRVVRE